MPPLAALRHHRVWLLAGLLVAFALRLFQLGGESLWYDETVSVVLARKSIPDLIAHTAGDIHPPGYYLLLHWWQGLVDPTLPHGLEWLFAWPSLYAGLLLVAILYPLGRRLFDARVALLGLWLAAINPFQIWYSQEVRMYTVGALWGLLALWALSRWQPAGALGRRHWGWLLLYAISAALGLYTLYYFFLVIITLNLIALGLLVRRGTKRQAWVAWIAAQLLLLALWSPWLGIFWHQATEPPVPPWRVPWDDGAALLAALSESMSALLSGQSAPLPTSPWWLVGMGVILLAAKLGYANKNHQQAGALMVGLYTFLPLLLLYLITVYLTPLYHVRYLFTYAPPYVLLVSAAVCGLQRRWPPVGAGLLILVVAMNGWSLWRFWGDPSFRSDDHRGAVAQLAAAWRPGDLILVNAGWAYTAIETYWPTTLPAVNASLPPKLGAAVRLYDYAQSIEAGQPVELAYPLLVRTGSIDGQATLGWGDPASDFFAIDSLTTAEALLTLSRHYARIWHYRLYDTVSDPKGQIRTWLAANGTQQLDLPIPGRDYLALQRYQSNHAPADLLTLTLPTGGPTTFGNGLTLQESKLTPTPVTAGHWLYLASRWERSKASLPVTVSFSLRLYNATGLQLAQQDETPHFPVNDWPIGTPTDLGLALPIPADLVPGRYSLALIVYDGTTGTPLPTATGAEQLTLGAVEVTVATTTPVITSRLARFDYIDLVEASASPQVSPGRELALRLVWLPQPNAYRDTYLARIALRDGAGQTVQQWEDALGGWDYPSGSWPPGLPVGQQQPLPIAPATPRGTYQLFLQVRRQSDSAIQPAITGWWQTQEELWLGAVVVE